MSGKVISPQQVKLLDEMLARPDNRNCADCGARGPRWASTNLGVFVCIRCSGIHRSMGTHISKVRSVNLDTWTPEQLAEFAKWGNARANELYEYNLPPNFSRPLESDNYGAEQFIRQKYERKVWMKPATAPAQHQQQPPQPQHQHQHQHQPAAAAAPRVAPQPVAAAPAPRVTPQPYAAPPGASPIDFASFQSASASSFHAPAASAPAAAAAPSFDLFGPSTTAPAPAPAPAPAAPPAAYHHAQDFGAFASAPTAQSSAQLDKNSIMNMYKQSPPQMAPSGPNYNVHLNQPQQPQQMYVMTANGPQLVYVQPGGMPPQMMMMPQQQQPQPGYGQPVAMQAQSQSQFRF